MKRFMVALSVAVLLPSLAYARSNGRFASGRSGRQVSSSRSRGMTIGGRGLGAGNRSAFSSSQSVSRVGFRNTSGRMVRADGGGTTTGNETTPTYAMIGSRVTSPGMFSTQSPIAMGDFVTIDAGGVRHDQPAVDQIVNYSRGIFTDPTLSGRGVSGSDGYGTLFGAQK